MTDKEKILAEIERLKDKGKYSDTYDYAFRDGNNGALDAIARFVNSLPEEPVSKDICNQCEAHNDKDKCDELVFGHKCPIVTTSEDLEEASEEYTGKVLERTNMLIGNQPVGEEIEAAFKAGAQWQKQVFEKNRLAACDRQTKEEAEREQDFVDKILLGEHRQPTFSDAIEYGAQWQKQQMMKDLLVGYVCLNQTAHNEELPDHCIITNEEPKEIFDKRGLKEGDLVKIIIIKED